MINIKNKMAKAMAISPLLAMLSDVHGLANVMPTIDVLGSQHITAHTLTKKCKHEVEEIAAKKALMSDIDLTTSQGQLLVTAVKQFKTCIMRGEKEYSVNLATIFYPSDNSLHLSVNLIEKNAMKIAFNPVPTQTLPDPAGLIRKWQTYERKMFVKVMQNKMTAATSNCPVFHCFVDYGNSELKADEEYFIKQVPKHITELTKILRDERDEKARAAAVLLLAHAHDGNELITILTHSIRDPNEIVRNNVLRVLAHAINKVKPQVFPIAEVVDALNFPTVTDANKALLVIANLITQQPKYYPFIVQHAGRQLLVNLKQQQPNVHDLAYYILKTVSGKKYAEHDYVAWENWLKIQNSY